MTKRKKQNRQDFDAYWKALLPMFLKDLIQLCMPEVYPYIDFSAQPRFLEQELHDISVKQGKKGKKYLDKLVDVKLKDGSNTWLLIHIEFQNYEDPHFPERMHGYYYRILYKYGRDLTALAVYTGDIKDQRDAYFRRLFTRNVLYEYYTYSIKDADEETLLASDNPFALAVLSAKYLIKSGKNLEERYQFKYRLIKLAFEKSYSRDKIKALLDFIYLLLPLDEAKESELAERITQELSKDMKSKEIKLDYVARMHELFYGESLDARISREREAEKQKMLAQQKAEKQKAVLAEKEVNIQNLLKTGLLSDQQIAETMNVSLRKVRSLKKKMTE